MKTQIDHNLSRWTTITGQGFPSCRLMIAPREFGRLRPDCNAERAAAKGKKEFSLGFSEWLFAGRGRGYFGCGIIYCDAFAVCYVLLPLPRRPPPPPPRKRGTPRLLGRSDR
jgi:hypothetical protein